MEIQVIKMIFLGGVFYIHK